MPIFSSFYSSVTVGSIERKLPKTTWDQWIERGQKKHIVILDQNMKYDEVTADSKVQCLKDAIYLYDSSCTLQSEPLILDGGFEAWVWHYPSLVTNPRLPEVRMNIEIIPACPIGSLKLRCVFTRTIRCSQGVHNHEV